jgi:hypothetical protein
VPRWPETWGSPGGGRRCVFRSFERPQKVLRGWELPCGHVRGMGRCNPTHLVRLEGWYLVPAVGGCVALTRAW